MLGKDFHLTTLESRKQLLRVESELNRAQLFNELRDFKKEIHHLQDQVAAMSSIVSSVAKLATTFSVIGGVFARSNNEEKKKSSWVSTLFRGARAGASIWSALRSNDEL